MDYSGDNDSRASDRFDLYGMHSDQLTSKVYRSWWKFFFWVFTVCMGSFYIGFTNTFAFTLMTNSNEQNPDRSKSWFLAQVGFYSLAGIAGALITNKISKKLSRRNCLSLAGIIGIIGTLFVWFSFYDDHNKQTNIVMIVGRIIQGIAGGMFSVLCPIIIKQIVPVQLSVTFGSFHQFAIVLGLLVVTAFALLITDIIQPLGQMDKFVYQLPLAIPIPVLVLKIILLQLVFKDQTPKYLIQAQRKQEAKKLIKSLYKNQFYMQIYIDLQHAVSVLDNPIYEGYNMTDIRRKIIFLGIYVAVMQQISGISIVNTYGLYPYQQFLQQKNDYWLLLWSGIQLASTSLLVIANLFSSNCPSTMKSFTRLLGKRKILFFIGNLMSVIILLAAVIITQLNWGSSGQQLNPYYLGLAITIIIFMIQYGLTLGPITWIYLSQILELRQMSFAAAANWLTGYVTITILPMLPSKNQGGIENALIVLLVCCIIFSFFNYKYIVQTKNQTPIQIVRTLSNTHLKNVLLCGFCQKEQSKYQNDL